MPQDPVAERLSTAPVPELIKADAWDAYQAATDEDDLAKRLRALPLPDSVRADLWDMKVATVAAPAAVDTPAAAPAAAAVPAQGFMDKLGAAAYQASPLPLFEKQNLPGTAAAVAGALTGGLASIPVAAGVGTLVRSAQGGTPQENLTEGAIQGGAAAAGPVIGAAKALAPRLMQSALKPGFKAILQDVKRGMPVPKVVQTLLDEGINVTKGGVSKLNDILTATNAEIRAAVSSAKGHIYPEAIADRTLDTAVKFGKTQQLTPRKDLATIRQAADEFLDVQSGGQYPAKPLTPLEAHDLKVGEYKHLTDKAYSKEGISTAETEAHKAMARGLKEDTASAVKASSGVDIDALNRREGGIIEAGEAVAKRVAQSGNRDLAGFAWATGGPLGGPAGAANFLMAIMDRSPAVKSMIARGMWSTAGKVAKVTPELIRGAVMAVAMDEAKNDEVR